MIINNVWNRHRQSNLIPPATGCRLMRARPNPHPQLSAWLSWPTGPLHPNHQAAEGRLQVVTMPPRLIMKNITVTDKVQITTAVHPTPLYVPVPFSTTTSVRPTPPQAQPAPLSTAAHPMTSPPLCCWLVHCQPTHAEHQQRLPQAQLALPQALAKQPQ